MTSSMAALRADGATPSRISAAAWRTVAIALAGTVAAVASAHAQPRPALRVLYVSHSAGFAHASRTHAGDVITALGQNTGYFTVTATEDVSILNEASLAAFDAVVFFTSGELPIDGAQKQALLNFIAGGKGFVGVHSATDTFHTWPEYGAMIGGYFETHPWTQTATVRVENQTHASTRHLGASFTIHDEFYQFSDWSRADVNVLLSLDTTSVPPAGSRPDNDYALAWTKSFGSGRVFYTALGHDDATWDDGRFRQHVLGGLQWAMGDTDGDGMKDDWERQFGLDWTEASGGDGSGGDPDGDGRTNLQELRAGTHPRGYFQRYLAEGALNQFFDVRLAIFNASGGPSHVMTRFLQPGGTVVSRIDLMEPGQRGTLTRADLTALTSPDFSTIVEADQPLVVDRTMWWDASGYGSHAETGVAGPSLTWYLAEGATGGDFSLFYLLQNPNPTPTTATVQFLRPFGQPPIVRSYPLAPLSRTTIFVDAEDPALANSDVSAAITAADPIIVERAMYRSTPAQVFAAGHGSAGVPFPRSHWFLAEGATGAFFDMFILIANPNSIDAQVEVDYLLTGGGVYTKRYVVPARGRFTIWVDEEQIPGAPTAKPLKDTALSAIVRSTNGADIVVERTMWWPSPETNPGNFWTEAHNAVGAIETGTRWGLAEGEAGGPQGAETYVLIANTSTTPGNVEVKLYFEGGGTAERTMVVAPSSRTTVGVGAVFPEAAGRRFAVTVHSFGAQPAEIVVERAMYRSPGGVFWAAGTNALATKLP